MYLGEGALSFTSIYIFKIKMTAQVLQLSLKSVAVPAHCCEKPLLGTLVGTKRFFRRDAGLAKREKKGEKKAQKRKDSLTTKKHSLSFITHK